MRLNTESKLPRLPASALKVSVGGWAGILPIIKSLPNEAELGCDNVLCRPGKSAGCSSDPEMSFKMFLKYFY